MPDDEVARTGAAACNRVWLLGRLPGTMWPRLTKRRQFERVYTRGRKRTASALVLFHLEETSTEPHVAFVASRKVGGAVQRNRARRLMRAAFTEVLRDRASMPPGWYVLVARRAILECKSPEVARQLRALIERLDGSGEAQTASRSELGQP